MVYTKVEKHRKNVAERAENRAKKTGTKMSMLNENETLTTYEQPTSREPRSKQ